jgi:TrpR family transcriptional regulator, trp operon repressor
MYNQALFALSAARHPAINASVEFMNPITRELIDIFTRTNTSSDMESLFREIFTSSEIDTLTLRWQLLKDLYEGKTQRKIAATHKISLCKITRGSKILKTEGSYLKKVLDELYEAKNKSVGG